MNDLDFQDIYISRSKGRLDSVSIDIVDFTLMCHKGLKKDTAFFEDLLQFIEEEEEEFDG